MGTGLAADTHEVLGVVVVTSVTVFGRADNDEALLEPEFAPPWESVLMAFSKLSAAVACWTVASPSPSRRVLVGLNCI